MAFDYILIHAICRLGINPVKGLLLHGPPGTGKTLIARQIGKMLNGREPKVIVLFDSHIYDMNVY